MPDPIVLILALLVGVALGLLGGGGSILTVPLLVYVADMPVREAVATSLLVVGVTALVASVPHARAGRVRWKTATMFGVAGMVGAYAGGRVGTVLPETVLLGAFALMMLLTSVAMLRGCVRCNAEEHDSKVEDGARPTGRIIIDGLVVGAVTGVVGAGGGFLVVPALVLLGGMPMHAAVGSSLVVIAMKSSAGLLGYLDGVSLDLRFAIPIVVATALGAIFGARFSTQVPAAKLRRGFGWSVLVMGALVLAEQLPQDLKANPLVWVAASLMLSTLVVWLVRNGDVSATLEADARKRAEDARKRAERQLSLPTPEISS